MSPDQIREQVERERAELRRQCAARKAERPTQRMARDKRMPWYNDELATVKQHNKRLRRVIDALIESELLSPKAHALVIRELNKP